MRVGVGVRVDVGWRIDVGVALPCSQGNVETCVYCLNSRRLLLQDTDDRPTQVRQNDSIVQCESCQRILYYVAPAASVAPPATHPS